jgi:DNA invertase Pin-like site-specific DNA recombinase
MIRAALYPRISKDDRADEDGVNRQLERLIAEAERRGWEHVAFIENDVSATKARPRPEYERLLAAVRAGEVQAVLVTASEASTAFPSPRW